MKTKYIAVPISERLPEKEGVYLVKSKQGFISEMKFYKNEEWLWKSSKEYWLEEVPDHSEEMLSALSEIMRFKHELRLVMSDKLQYPDNFLKALDNAEELINKVKDNGRV
ncbi:hypothetical protein CMU75_09015 [Elizabethkingia anophelis]|nr:hypothetical protein [Elizabethkingia anophelis]MDV3653257.1 hypothetical protein [Elizabethkingia anophelis]